MTALGRESKRRRATRYAAVGAIVLVLSALFVHREFREARDGIVESAQLKVGVIAPDFVLPTDDGHIRLSDLRGHVVLLNFWASWCGPCRFEMPAFQSLHEERDDAVRVLAVNVARADSREAARAFVEDLGLTFAIAFDSAGTVADAYGVHALPATFFIDREGVLRARAYGPVLGDRLQVNLAAAGG